LVDHNVFERRLRKLEQLLSDLRSLAKLDQIEEYARAVAEAVEARENDDPA